MFTNLRNCIRSCWYAYRFAVGGDQTMYGLRRATYYRLSKRLKDLADTVDSVNSSLVGSPVSYLVGLLQALPNKEQRRSASQPNAFRVMRQRRLLESARGLPDALRDYASALRLRIRSRRKGRQRRDIVRDQWVRLVRLIERETGTPHYSEAATILETVASVAGKNADIPLRALEDACRRYRGTSGKFPIALEEDDPEHPLLQEFLDPLPSSKPQR